jgi:hypothetical protein
VGGSARGRGVQLGHVGKRGHEVGRQWPRTGEGGATARGASVTHVSWPGVHVTGEMGTDRWGLAQRHAIDKWV